MNYYDDNDPIFDEEARANHMKEIKKRRAQQYLNVTDSRL